MKFLKAGLLALGLLVLALAVRAADPAAIAAHLAQYRWKLAAVLTVYPLVFFFHTLGWRYAFPKALPAVLPWSDLWRIRVIGETLNVVLPWSASLGGEPVKAALLKGRHGIPLSEGYASLLVVHVTFWVSINAFVLGAAAVSAGAVPITPALWKSLAAFLAVLALGGGALLAALLTGFFERAHSFGDRFKFWGALSEDKRRRFADLDREIRSFLSSDRKRFFLSTGCNLLGWLAGAAEVWITCWALGHPIGWREAWVYEALFQALRIATFFVPASVGTQEGGIVWILSQFGFAAPWAMAFALIRRARELLWIAIGLALWGFLKDRRG